ncbi:DUF4231 domain-containing protein [Nocardiopsis mwathae]|nr:DUF4231 domain-containing protein [Nocardiopsis mwathae]
MLDVDESPPGHDIAYVVLRLRDRYRRRANRGVVLFRASGALLITVGGLMPVLAMADYPFKTATLSVAGVLMSLSASLHTFFRWDRQWQILRSAQFRLEDAYLEWSLRTAALADLPEEEKRRKNLDADRHLLDRYKSIREGESKQFFTLLHFPSTSGTQPDSGDNGRGGPDRPT